MESATPEESIYSMCLRKYTQHIQHSTAGTTPQHTGQLVSGTRITAGAYIPGGDGRLLL